MTISQYLEADHRFIGIYCIAKKTNTSGLVRYHSVCRELKYDMKISHYLEVDYRFIKIYCMLVVRHQCLCKVSAYLKGDLITICRYHSIWK